MFSNFLDMLCRQPLRPEHTRSDPKTWFSSTCYCCLLIRCFPENLRFSLLAGVRSVQGVSNMVCLDGSETGSIHALVGKYVPRLTFTGLTFQF